MRRAPEGSVKLTSSILTWGCGRTTNTARPCERVASPVKWRICEAISARKAAFEKAQGAVAAAIATSRAAIQKSMALPKSMKRIRGRRLRGGGEEGEELETTVADSAMALGLPLTALREKLEHFHGKTI